MLQYHYLCRLKKMSKEKKKSKLNALNRIKRKHILNRVVRSLTVGNTLSLALNDTNNANGTIHKHIVK